MEERVIKVQKPKYIELRKAFITFIKWYNQNADKCVESRNKIKQLYSIYSSSKEILDIPSFFKLKQIKIAKIHHFTWSAYEEKQNLFIVQYLIQIILDYVPKNTTLIFKPSITGLLYMEFPDNFGELTIIENNTWDEIKRNIKIKLQFKPMKTTETCPVCMEEVVIYVPCNKCTNHTCTKCYTDIIKINKGLYVCPFCRNEIGRLMDDEQLKWFCERLEENIRYRSYLKNYLIQQRI